MLTTFKCIINILNYTFQFFICLFSSTAEGCSLVVEEILSLYPEAHEIKDDNGATPLILAAGITNKGIAENMINLLLKAGADCKAKDNDGVQALHHACGGGETTVVDLLVKAGAPLDTCSKSGSPLHWASGEGCYEVVEQLIKLGANVDCSANSQGLTPIFMAAARGADKCLAMLARGGAQVGKTLGGGLNILHIASEVGLKQGVEALLESPEGRACAIMRDDSGRLPIHLAAAAAQEDVVNMLIKPSFPQALNPPTLKDLMLDGGKTALAYDQAQAQEAIEKENKKSLISLIENVKPATSEEEANKAKTLKDEGNVLYIAKDYTNAILKYTDAILIDGSDATFFSNRSACWLELGKLDMLKEATRSSDKPVETQVGAAEEDDMNMNIKRALADAEQCRRMRPDWEKACFRLASARLAAGLYEDAAVAAYEGLKIDDQNNSLKKLLKESVAKGREAHFKTSKN